MIAPLRRLHRRVIVVLAVVVPVVVVAALVARRDFPANAETPSDRRLAILPQGPPATETDTLFTAEALRARLWRESDGAILALEPLAPLTAPDLLLYGSADDTASGDALPADAVLLGAVPGNGVEAYVLPPGSGDRLVLYSLAWQRVVDGAPLPVAGAAGGGR